MRLLVLAFFSIAMAFVESAVVVYLRALFYPDGFSVSMRTFPTFYYTTEILREAATIVMLCAVALLSARKGWRIVLPIFSCALVFGTSSITCGSIGSLPGRRLSLQRTSFFSYRYPG